MPEKHELNPAIVTVLGAGIAGLTAAHELVERGFLVQVVEAEEDPRCPGRPLVGGLAANQPARVRANVEDLHPELLHEAVEKKNRVAAVLLEVFAFNRSSWLATEVPARVHPILYSKPDPQKRGFTGSLIDSLIDARRRFRERWIWDLAVRSVLIEDIKPADPKENLLGLASYYYQKLVETQDSLELAKQIFEVLKPPGVEFPALEQERDTELLVSALEREFLCFRLVPRALRGFETAPANARALYADWSKVLGSDETLKHCSISNPDSSARLPVLPTEAALAAFDAAPDLAHPTHWLELQVIEQRLPGEHGFRFFPSFYRHLDDTMQRTPLFQGRHPTGGSVLDNLKSTVFQGIGFSERDLNAINAEGGRAGRDSSDPSACETPKGKGGVVPLKRDMPKSLEGLRERTDRLVARLGGNERDAIWIFAKLLRFMTSSPERRRKEYEDKTWAQFLELEKLSTPMQTQINATAQALVGFSVTQADARTYGNTALQLLLDQLKDPGRVDRTLNGPTSDAWLEPWRDYLERQGVRFFRRKVSRLVWHGREGELVPEFEPAPADNEAILSQDGYELLTHESASQGHRPDFYVLALNIETAHHLVSNIYSDGAPPDPKRAPDFQALREFWTRVDEKGALRYATGLQFFFDAKTSLGQGHMYFPRTSWGLSSISQSEFWSARGGFADGYFGVLSIGVFNPGQNTADPKREDLWHMLRQKTYAGAQFSDEHVGRFSVARKVWEDVQQRISERDKLGEPRCFHIDQKLLQAERLRAESVRNGGNPAQPLPGFSRYLASLSDVERARPGRDPDNHLCVGENEVEYSVNHRRWVVCSTFMATHTRLTTMESANESARHAVRAILAKLQEVHCRGRTDKDIQIATEKGTVDVKIKALTRKDYNGPSRVYDPPDIFNPEDFEVEDLDIFRRVDRRLVALGLPHFLEILDFDRKLAHALDGAEIYRTRKPLKDVVGSLVAGLDATLVRDFGREYRSDDRLSFEKLKDVLGGLRAAVPLVEKPGDKPGDRPVEKPLFEALQGLLENLAEALP